MSEIVDITVGVIQEEITISAVNNIGEVTVNAVNNSEEINITANTNLIQININTAPISIINPQDYDLSEFTNISSNPFIRQSTLSSYVPISRTITINGTTLDLSADRSWTIPAAIWGSITGTLSSQTDLQAALNAKQDDLTLTTTGSSGAATLIGATLNIPNYTISGLGGVPSSRTLTINGTSYDLSADRSWTISTGITIGTTAIASGTVGRVLFEGAGNVVQESSSLTYDDTLKTFTLIGPISSVIQHTALTNYNGLGGIQLNVADGTERGFFKLNPTSGEVRIGATGSGYFPTFYAQGVEAMRIFASTRNVGIGTTTDAGFRLDVNGTLRAGSTTISSSVFNVLSTGSSLFFVDSGSNNYRVANLITWGGYHPGAGTNNTGDIFSVGSNPSSSANNSPFFRLNFNGGNSSGIYGSSGNNNVTAQLNATTSANFYVTAQGAGGLVQGSTSGFLISTISDGQNLSLRSEKGTGNSGGGINYLSSLNGSNHSHRWYHNNTEQMRLWYTGNLTIQNGGTFTDAGYRLDVQGSVRIKGAGTTNATISLRVENNAGTASLVCYDDLAVYIDGKNQSGFATNIRIGGQSNQANMSFFGNNNIYVGQGNSVENIPSALIAMGSTTKGFLLPRMTTIQKNAIATPATGLLVYDTDLNTLSSFNGTVWSTIGGSVAWGSITGTLSAQTDLQSVLDTKVPYTGATANVDLGEYEIKTGQLTLDTTPTGTAAVGTTRWNDAIGSSETTLKGGNVVLKNGVDLVARVVNKVTPNATLLRANYTAVRISGAQGQRLAVAYAQANIDLNSADTIGLVAEDIATNQEGFVITVGELLGINTTGALQSETWADGDVLYLSPTLPGAVTNIKPTGLTGHIVVIGYVEYAHAIHGKIYVKIMNGWELDELHNVYINPSTLSNNDLLQYDSASQLWKNESLSSAGIEPTITPGTTSQYWRGDKTWQTFPTIPSVTPSALTKTDDTNVTITLGGSPSNALLQAVSIVVGWTGTLADSRIASAATWNAKQNAITLTTTGTSGPATLVGNTLNIPQYSGGGASIIKLSAQTLLAASWTLSGGYYIYTFTNVNITTNTRVDFTPDNSAYSEVTTCGMLPEVDVFAGSCRFYSLFPPQSNILGEITIFPTI